MHLLLQQILSLPFSTAPSALCDHFKSASLGVYVSTSKSRERKDLWIPPGTHLRFSTGNPSKDSRTDSLTVGRTPLRWVFCIKLCSPCEQHKEFQRGMRGSDQAGDWEEKKEENTLKSKQTTEPCSKEWAVSAWFSSLGGTAGARYTWVSICFTRLINTYRECIKVWVSPLATCSQALQVPTGLGGELMVLSPAEGSVAFPGKGMSSTERVALVGF